jgi:hypothetical protein
MKSRSVRNQRLEMRLVESVCTLTFSAAENRELEFCFRDMVVSRESHDVGLHFPRSKSLALFLFQIMEGHTVMNDYEKPLPHTYLETSALPDSFTWVDVDGVSYLTHSLNQHLPQVSTYFSLYVYDYSSI